MFKLIKAIGESLRSSLLSSELNAQAFSQCLELICSAYGDLEELELPTEWTQIVASRPCSTHTKTSCFGRRLRGSTPLRVDRLWLP